MRPTVRLRLALLYAAIVFVAGALLLTVSYVLVRNNLTVEGSQLGPLGAPGELERAVREELADDTLDRLRLQYALALAAMTVVSMALGWIVAGRVLRPLQRITAAAQRVSQDTLDERIALGGPKDELRELADTFDGMLGRLAGAFASQRRFVANASHELRTPLSVMRTELEVTLADPHATNAELRAMGETVRDAVERTERLIQALLTLARSEATVTRQDALGLDVAARMALDPLGEEIAAAGLRVGTDLAPAPVCGDRRLLERLVANLVENAVRHNRPGGRVHIETCTSGGRSRVRVANDGEAIPPEVVPRLLEPFQRLDRGARGDGAGLGLSIVRSVAAAHGGDVHLAARPQGGLEAVVSLPEARERAPLYEGLTSPGYPGVHA